MVRLILYNVEYLQGLKGRKIGYAQFWRRLVPPENIEKEIVKELKKQKPDIVSLVEIGTDTLASRKEHIDYFKKELGMKSYVTKVKYKFRGAGKLFGFIPFLGTQSNAILSKKKISSVKTHYLKEGMKRAVIQAEINLPKKVTLLLAHLALGDETRKEQLSELTGIVKKIKGPVILMGDFNTFAGGKELAGLLKETSLKNKLKLSEKTYPSFRPRKRFDYILTSKEIKVKKTKVLYIKLSDHLPILVDFEVKGK